MYPFDYNIGQCDCDSLVHTLYLCRHGDRSRWKYLVHGVVIACGGQSFGVGS